MKNSIVFLLRLSVFWLCLFTLQHTFFLLYNRTGYRDAALLHVLRSYSSAFAMDLAATAYLISIPAILLIISLFIRKNSLIIRSIHIFNYILIIICIIISISDTALFSAWGSKLNSKALSYLLYPKEAITSFAAVPYWFFIFVLIIAGIFAIIIYKRFLYLNIDNPVKLSHKLIFPFVLLFLLFVSIRGGFQTFPINKSWVYYSKYPVLNYAALNGFWNIMEILVNPDISSNPYTYFGKEKAESIVKQMFEVSSDSNQMILTSVQPNIVLVLLESVSAECVYRLGGIKGLMPGFDSLAEEGLLFTNFYASGFRTEQGEISLFTGFPAQPQTTIMRKFGKFDKLPNLPLMLGEKGYSENYYYSGNTDFANTGVFLKFSGFTKIYNEDNYPWQHTTDWGAYDEELFACHLEEAEKDRQPFFSILMTSTNHEPFDANVEKIYTGKSEADAYRNTVFYTDKCLKEYLKKAKTKPWYKNTLFIIAADHAHNYPYDREANEVERHHIPFLLFGEALDSTYRGKICDKVGSQIDFPAILLNQLGISSRQFPKSKNLLNRHSPEFAFYTFDNGFGIVTPQQAIVYDHTMQKIVYRKNKLPPAIDRKITDQGKAFLQLTFEDYIRFTN
jgi:phosphoglycerol transferase MdoB-like AlkP superfamily enzyme